MTESLFAEINALLAEHGAFLREGTIANATITAAPPSTTNKAKECDFEMHQTNKGNTWHFGGKAHVGVDLDSRLMHTVLGTAANVADIAQAHAPLHGEEKVGFGDAGYQGLERHHDRERCQSTNVRRATAYLRKERRDCSSVLFSDTTAASANENR